MRRLPLVCPSNTEGVSHFYHQPCVQKGCIFWGATRLGKGCTAGQDTSDAYRHRFVDKPLPPCPLSESCTWNVDAVRRGEPGCGPRRLGLICEHQPGGDEAIWNTFDIAPPDDDDAWG